MCNRKYKVPVMLLLMLGGGICDLHAQNEVQTSMYWATPSLYNPSTVGSDSAMHVAAFNRMQWVGVKNSPQTFFASIDLPVKLLQKRIGVGATVMNDKAGLFNTTQIEGQLSMSYKLWGGRLALGLQGGFVNQGFSGSDIFIPEGDAWDPNDDALPSGDVSAMTFDTGFGAYYERVFGHSTWYGGIGIQHLVSGEVELDEYVYSELERTYFFHAGGNIPIKRSLFSLQPSLLIKSVLNVTQMDFTLRTTYNKMFWGGFNYRPGDAVTVMIGADVGNVRLGYGYDIGISPLARASHGSHEIMATYSMHLDLDKKKQHQHKSIRIL